MNILDYKLYYFLGAGGIGMSALVRYFNHYGKISFGYDKVQSNLTEQLQKEGTQLQLAPKITVLSQTLGGELEVRLPNGKTSFMTPEEYQNYLL